MFTERDDDRGQVGIGTLIVFIAMVPVAAIAAGVLINTAGFLQSKSEETGEQSSQQVTNRLQVQQSSGLVTSNDGSTAIGAVELIATKAPGAEDIDLEGVTMQWVDDSGTYDLVHARVLDNEDADGAFDHVAIKDDDNSLSDGSPVINTPDDRSKIVVDLGSQDDSAELSDHFGETSEDQTIRGAGLPEGSSAQLRITTQSGSVSTVRLNVPESLSGKSAASL